MRILLAVLCCVFSQAFSYFPHSSIGNSEVIGDLQEGLLISLPDFVYMGETIDNGSPCLRYRSRIFPDAVFVFVHDYFGFDSPLSLADYADRFTQTDFFAFPYKERAPLFGGVGGSTPMLCQWWENSESYYFQLYFGRRREGFCCCVLLPKSGCTDELYYWEDFFAELPYLIQISQ